MSKPHFKYYPLFFSSHYWVEAHDSPTRLGGHHHVNSVHTNPHDVNDSLPCFSVGQTEDAQGLEAGDIAVGHKHHKNNIIKISPSTFLLSPHLLNNHKVMFAFLHAQ